MPENQTFNVDLALTVAKKAHTGEIIALGNYFRAIFCLKEHVKTLQPDEIKDEFLRNLPRINQKIWQAYLEACRLVNKHCDVHEAVKETRAFLLRINQILSRYGAGTDWEEGLSIAAMLHLCTDYPEFERSSCEHYFGLDVARFIFDMPQESEEHFKECKTKADREKKVLDYLNRFAAAPIPSILILCAVQIDALEFLTNHYPIWGERIWKKRGMPNKNEQLWYFNQIVEVFGSNEALKANPDYSHVDQILAELNSALERALPIFGIKNEKTKSRHKRKDEFVIA